jgi:phage shock protein PspC (stress-responsive transcriptional regulator)
MTDATPDERAAIERVKAAVGVAMIARAYRKLWIKLATAFVIAAAAAFLAWPTAKTTVHPVAVTAAFIFLVMSPAVVAFVHLRATAGGPHRVYKRLRGRMISGVCRGLSEAYGLPVWFLRALFLAPLLLRFAHFGRYVYSSLAIYLVLDAILPVHPSDRNLLLRIRFRRWLAGRR